ncbi:hypothetical protein HDU91_005098 [Kappamyces sp. JEL0680]|nr:hypothetical protein HDU91_005098 [Kappamyces sp. JEL0680]
MELRTTATGYYFWGPVLGFMAAPVILGITAIASYGNLISATPLVVPPSTEPLCKWKSNAFLYLCYCSVLIQLVFLYYLNYRLSGIRSAFNEIPNVVRYFPTQALNLASKDLFRSMFPKYNPKTEFWKFLGSNMASGGAAGAVSLSVVYPLDYARTRLASDVGKGQRTFTGIYDCLKKTAQGPKGVLGLYQGFGVSVAGIVAYRGAQFGLNDTIKGFNPYGTIRSTHVLDKDVTMVGIASKFLAAQVSVIISGYASYPFDTVRRRLMMESEKPLDTRLYRGTIDCFGKIVKNEGVSAMFKGAGANILRGTGAALVLVLYGEASNYMKG